MGEKYACYEYIGVHDSPFGDRWVNECVQDTGMRRVCGCQWAVRAVGGGDC